MKLKYLQQNQLFELVGDSRKSKASLFLVFVVVVVAAARLELHSPRFKVISRVFGGIWKDTFNSSKFLHPWPLKGVVKPRQGKPSSVIKTRTRTELGPSLL